MIAFVTANCPPRLRSRDSVDGSMIIACASKSALYLDDAVPTAVSIAAVPTKVGVWIVSVIRIGIGIEERERERVHKDESSIVETVERLLKNRCVPAMVRGANRGAGRVIAGRPILAGARIAAGTTDGMKLAAATQIKMHFIFITNSRFSFA
jgi:hypothetical protein